MKPVSFCLLSAQIICLVTARPVSSQTVGLSFLSDGTSYFTETTPFQSIHCYISFASGPELESATTRIEFPAALTFLGASPYECDGCSVTYDPQSQAVEIVFGTCFSALEPLVVAQLTLLYTQPPLSEESICLAEGEASYVTCDQQPGELQFFRDYSCRPDPLPRCLHVNWLEPCGLSNHPESWGAVKAQHSRPAG